MDLGECPKYHELALKADYEMASKEKDYYYDIDVSFFVHFCRGINTAVGDTIKATFNS